MAALVTTPRRYYLYTALCNHNRIAFEEMSSWTANMDEDIILDQIHEKQIFSKFEILRVIKENAYLKKTAHNN